MSSGNPLSMASLGPVRAAVEADVREAKERFWYSFRRTLAAEINGDTDPEELPVRLRELAKEAEAFARQVRKIRERATTSV